MTEVQSGVSMNSKKLHCNWQRCFLFQWQLGIWRLDVWCFWACTAWKPYPGMRAVAWSKWCSFEETAWVGKARQCPSVFENHCFHSMVVIGTIVVVDWHRLSSLVMAAKSKWKSLNNSKEDRRRGIWKFIVILWHWHTECSPFKVLN